MPQKGNLKAYFFPIDTFHQKNNERHLSGGEESKEVAVATEEPTAEPTKSATATPEVTKEPDGSGQEVHLI